MASSRVWSQFFPPGPDLWGLGPRSSRLSCPFTLPTNVPDFILSNNGAFPWKEVEKSFPRVDVDSAIQAVPYPL